MSNCRHVTVGRTCIASRGFVLIAVLAVLAISLTLFGVWARGAVAQHRRSQLENVRLQAVRLAEAGVRRAVAMRAADVTYQEEKWSVPTGVLDTKRSAEVRIQVAPNDDHTMLRFSATAEFPLGVVQRAQITRHVEIPNPEPRKTP
jgi:Tfp pilus assembly protein PilX